MIAIVACLGLAVDLKTPTVQNELDFLVKEHGDDHYQAVYDFIEKKLQYLNSSRPTAVNLSNALAELREDLSGLRDVPVPNGSTRCQIMVDAIVKHARFMLDRDAKDNMTLAAHGADEIMKDKPKDAQATIMTICNTGALATSHYGTALGVVRALRDRNQLKKVVALETRPYNQGSRLTAFEIVEEKMPGGTLICDSMAAAFMDKEPVSACVIGADRVCANGDTANKVGSYALALAASAHNVPVYVAAPFTTLDVNTAHGKDIHIEERPAEELLESSRAPKGINVWNPAFDVTPSKYITGIITERGIILRDNDNKIDVTSFVQAHKDDDDQPDTKKARVN